MRAQVVKDVEKEFLEPSFQYLMEHGLENTSVRDLCRVMDVSYGSLYYWFDGKDDIYISVVKYGIGKVVAHLLEYAMDFAALPDEDPPCDLFLAEVDKCKKELRLIMQVTASPVYGDRMRLRAEDFKQSYEEYIQRLAEICNQPIEKTASVFYLLISVVIDYVVWEDYEVSKQQLQYLWQLMK